jgi:hypothetical protein
VSVSCGSPTIWAARPLTGTLSALTARPAASGLPEAASVGAMTSVPWPVAVIAAPFAGG